MAVVVMVAAGKVVAKAEVVTAEAMVECRMPRQRSSAHHISHAPPDSHRYGHCSP